MKVKKFIAGLSAMAVMATPMTAFANDPFLGELGNPITEQSDPQSGSALITTEIAPTYIVTIPADTTVAFNTLRTDFGSVELTQARLEPNAFIRVSLDSDYELKNAADDSKTIPYDVVMEEQNEDQEFVYNSVMGEDIILTETGEKADLDIDITQEDWDSAYAGNYADTVTFNVLYDYEEAELPENMVAIKFSFEYYDEEIGENVPVNGTHYLQFEPGKTWAETIKDGDLLAVGSGNVFYVDDDHEVSLIVREGTADNIGADVDPNDEIDHDKSYIAVPSVEK